MKNSIKAITALLCCFSLLFAVSCSGNGGSTDESTTKAGDTVSQDSGVSGEDSSLPEVTDDVSVPGDVTEKTSDAVKDKTKKTTEKTTADKKQTAVTKAVTSKTGKVIRLADGLTSTNMDEVIKFYQLVYEVNKDIDFHKEFDFKYLDSGDDMKFIGKIVNTFKGLVNIAFKNNTIDDEPFPGYPPALKPSDLVYAKAVNDGTYTTITIKAKEQIGGAHEDKTDGTVGRTISVVDYAVATVERELGAEVEYKDGDFEIYYQNPVINVKVKNSTGEFVKDASTWTDTVDVKIYDVTAKIGILTLHFKNAEGIVDYLCRPTY